MKFIDYKRRLGVAFSDIDKTKMFIAKIKSYIQSHSEYEFSEKEEVDFCINTASECLLYNPPFIDFNDKIKTTTGISRICFYLDKYKNLSDYLAALMIFVNLIRNDEIRKELLCKIEEFLDDCNILYQIHEDSSGIYIFPTGAKELDDALISETFDWLNDYPLTKKAWIDSLKKYHNSNELTASETADSFRKALERFFQEFFTSSKSLENLKSEYGIFMSEKGVPAELKNNFEKLLESYTNYINSYAKHHDKVSKNLLEYIMYQTGNLIRLLIKLKSE